MIYRLDFNDVEFWKKKYDEQTKEMFYERVKQSGKLYFRMENHYYLSNKMICNCINDMSDTSENMRLGIYSACKNYCIIEPSGIKIPIDNLKKVSDREEIVKDKNNVFEDISINTFICNCISDRTRSGRNKISASEVESYKKEITEILGTSLGENKFSPFDLVAMFSFVCDKKGAISFNRDKLIEFIIENKEKQKYLRILKSTRISRGEHYDSSEDIDKSIDALKYFGMLTPDYYKEVTHDYNPYIDLSITPNIVYWNKMGIGKQLKLLYPEMFEFVDEYVALILGTRCKAKKRKK